jgi:hypothetical protein
MNYLTDTLLSAAATTGVGTAIDVWNADSCCLHFVNTGSPSGTVTWEGTVDGSTWEVTPVEKPDGSVATTTTATGMFRLPKNHGLKQFRPNVTSRASGTFTVLSGRRWAT